MLADVGGCEPSLSGRHTQEVLQPPLTHGWVFVYDVHTNNMCLRLIVSSTSWRDLELLVQEAVLLGRYLSLPKQFGATAWVLDPG